MVTGPDHTMGPYKPLYITALASPGGVYLLQVLGGGGEGEEGEEWGV